MPSIATQTSWSWVHDLEEIGRLARSYGGEDSHFSVLSPVGATRVRLTYPAEREEWNIQSHCATSSSKCHGANMTSDSFTLPPILTQKASNHGIKKKSHTVTFPSPDREENIEVDPQSISVYSTASYDVMNEEDSSSNTTSFVPSPLENKTGCSSDSDSRDVTLPPTSENRDDTRDTSMSVFDQLEQIDYSEPEESATESDDVTSSEDDGEDKKSDADDDIIPKKANIPDLEPAILLSWPTILQYVKESESRMNQYFSLDNKEAVETRTKEAKEMLYRNTGDTGTSQSPDGNSLTSRKSKEESSETARDGSSLCQFCGRKLPRRSLLAESQDIEKMKEQDYFCCTEYKEYKVLVAVCMRQMVERMRTAPPDKIVLKPCNKIAEKKQLEVKALLILRRKQRREEIRRRRELEQEARKHTRSTKTIQFTLDSPNESQQGWALKKKATNKIHNRLGMKAATAVKKRSKNTEERVEMFSAETLERLGAEVIPRVLERRFFSSGKTYLTILPDRTGYCNYPSGRKAVVFFALYEGALAYMVYEDSDHPQLLACTDELGRSCCYHLNGKMRFLCIPQLMVQFDASSQTQRKVRCSGTDATLIQPVSIPLNKYINFKCNQESMSLTVLFPHDHIKFTICSKLHKDEAPRYSSQLLTTVGAAEAALTRTKSRIGQLLHLLQNISQIQKLSKLEELYGTPMSKGGESSHPLKNDGNSRRRTKSMGGIKLGENSAERGTKHTRALTSDLT